MKYAIVCALVLLFVNAHADNFTDEQTEVLKIAKEIGEEIGWPETIQAIVLQETLAGDFGNRIGDTDQRIGLRSYGVAQVKVATARFVFNNYPEIKDQYFGTRKIRKIHAEEIIVLLMTNDEACILIASKNFELMMKYAKGSWSKAVAAYNGGWGVARRLKNPRKFEYVRHINDRIKRQVRPFNLALK